MSGNVNKDRARSRRHRGVALVRRCGPRGEVGLSYAAVPLYRLFCQVTGYGGTTQRVEQYSDTILDQTITVRFDANVNGLPWDFRPREREVTIRIGDTAEIAYLAENLAQTATAGSATFNVAPPLAGAYFNKIECFCFTEQELQPGESYEMPVQFFVDPEIVNAPELKNLKTIRLSYTVYPRREESAGMQAADAAQARQLGG